VANCIEKILGWERSPTHTEFLQLKIKTTATTTTSTTKDKLTFNQVLQKKLKSRFSFILDIAENNIDLFFKMS
jgi:hypothetical protein